MIYFRRESGRLRNGLNLYTYADWRTSRGFIWSWGTFAWCCRYSVFRKCWFICKTRTDRNIFPSLYDGNDLKMNKRLKKIAGKYK